MVDSHNDIRKRPEGVLLRTYLQAAGVAPESFEKPLIGVATSSTQVFSEKPDARLLSDSVQKGIDAGGGLARRWDMTRTPDLMSWGHAEGYSFAWRDQLADLIESWSRQETLEGLVLVGDAPESLIGMAMAAARLNLPAIIVPVGAQKWSLKNDGKDNSARGMNDPYDLITEHLFGKKKGGITPDEEHFSKCLLSNDNHESSAVDFALEALGVVLPGLSSLSMRSPQKLELAFASGERVVAMVKSGISFRRILTPNAFHNALRVSAALGGSIDVGVHMLALAQEAGQPFTLDTFERISHDTPQVTSLGGVSEKAFHDFEEFDSAGGVWAVAHAIRNLILPTNTIGGRGAMDLAKSSIVRDPRVISESKPLHKSSGLGVLKGNLAPKGALFLINQVLPDLAKVSGPVRVFEQEIDATKAVSEGQIKKGTILVVRGQGPKGGPGLKKLRVLPALLESRNLNKTIPVLTDGRLPDSPAGLFVSGVSPEGASSGPFAILKDGDVVDIDVAARSLSVRLTMTDLQIRMARWQEPERKSPRSFLTRYSKSVSEVFEGAVLK